MPTPGINLKALDTIVRPKNVAELVPPTAPIKLTNVDWSTAIPKIAVIWASIVTCMGTKRDASANGMGTNPMPKVEVI